MKEVKNLKRKISGMLEILRHMSQGQGYAGVSTFDPGAGGDATFSIQINLERDGLNFGRKDVDRTQIVDAITFACEKANA